MPPSLPSALADELLRLVRRGADHYNEGRYWHAHEAWEEGWLALREAGLDDAADYLQGLILVTAGFENLRRGKPRGFSVQLAKGLHRLREHRGHGPHLGLVDEEAFVEAVLDVYLLVQRRKLQRLDALQGQGAAVPRLVVEA